MYGTACGIGPQVVLYDRWLCKFGNKTITARDYAQIIVKMRGEQETVLVLHAIMGSGGDKILYLYTG